MSKPKVAAIPYQPPAYDPAAGKKALAALKPVLDALAPGELATLKLDVQTAAHAALAVAGFILDPKVHARFARLPKKEFAIADVDGLAPACFATLYALAEARAAGALESDAKVTPELAAEASEIEARMQAVCEYHLSDDPEIAPELDRLRPGSGHRDLADDLLGYARIYDLRRDVVKVDPKRYRANDTARAREIAGRIIQALAMSMTPKARSAWERYARAWTLLSRRYDEVRAAGLWLFRADPQKDQRFPSLFAAARSAARAKTPPEAQPAPEPTPTPTK